jgi:hypothetical protein
MFLHIFFTLFFAVFPFSMRGNSSCFLTFILYSYICRLPTSTICSWPYTQAYSLLIYNLSSYNLCLLFQYPMDRSLFRLFVYPFLHQNSTILLCVFLRIMKLLSSTAVFRIFCLRMFLNLCFFICLVICRDGSDAQKCNG